jgi:hypothetical protein
MTALTLTPPPAPARTPAHPKRWAILALVLAVECMDLLDGTSAGASVRASRRWSR